MKRIEEIKESLAHNYGEFTKPIKDWRYIAIVDLIDRVEKLEKVIEALNSALYQIECEYTGLGKHLQPCVGCDVLDALKEVEE